MTKIIEVQKSWRETPESADEHAQKLIALGWLITEETTEHYVLQHDLIPGSSRIIIRT